MSATVIPLQAKPDLPTEEEARAGYYALLARLFQSGPDAELLKALVASADSAAPEGTPLAAVWRELAVAARDCKAEEVILEYDEVFVGVGKAEVTPYVTHYLATTGQERLLAGLRDVLAQWGLARSRSAHEPEDHVSALFEVMRFLIAEGADDAALQKQRVLFEKYLAPAYRGFCDAICASAKARFYKSVARFAKTFLDIESDAFQVF